eukprot:COSAG02_NODE_831_length_16662_cov_25.818270_13_plen_506_part_00
MFLEGTPGETFYVVLGGTVNILQNHQPPVQDGEKTTVPCNGTETLVAQLGRGASFGELSILGASGSERKRAASAVAGNPRGAMLGVLGRDDYLRLIQQEQRRQTSECVTQLRSVRILRSVSTLSLTRMSVLMRKNRITFKRGEIILAQGAVPTRLLLLTSGEVLIQARDSPRVDNGGIARDQSIFAVVGKKPQLHDLSILACGAGGSAEIVGESCCVEGWQASRASIATFVAHSARVEGFFLHVDDVDRLTGAGRVRANKAFAPIDGIGSPLGLALQAFARERSTQLRQRLQQTLSIARSYTLEHRRQANQRHLPLCRSRDRDRVQDSLRPVGSNLATRGASLSARGNYGQYGQHSSSCSMDAAGSPKQMETTANQERNIRRQLHSARCSDTSSTGSTSSRFSGSQGLAFWTGVSSRGMVNNDSAAESMKKQHSVGLEHLATVQRCPSLNSWIVEVSCAPTTPRRRRPNRHAVAAPARLVSAGRSATRVRMTSAGLFSVPIQEAA